MEKLNVKIISLITWIISIIIIFLGLIYIDSITIPSIAIILVGIILLPPVNRKIQNKLEHEEKIKKYKIARTIVSIIAILFFLTMIPQNSSENQGRDNNLDIAQINQNEIDKSVSKVVNETNGKYTGERIEGKKQGYGKYEWNDGSIYEGNFKDDKISGIGKLSIPDKGTYEGNFVNGRKEGEGKYCFNNGDTYIGKWLADTMSGEGTYTFANGDTYVGEFFNNKFKGKGTYTQDGHKYTGTWKNNKYTK